MFEQFRNLIKNSSGVILEQCINHNVIEQCNNFFCDPSMSGVRRPCVLACVCASTISLNNISSETAYWILTKLHRNDPWVVPYQSCSNGSDWLHK